MAHTYTSLLVHCVFGTKQREKWVVPDMRRELWAYIGGIVRECDARALKVGGIDDHVHALLSLPPTSTVAQAVQRLKAGSSRWINETFPSHRAFAWQEGYGAFSVARSQVDKTVAYIRSQEAHHRTRTFEDEYREFLKRNGVAYDERYLT